MGGVPVLLVTMLLGMSGTPFHHGVSFFHGVDLETGFVDSGVVQRDVTSKLNSHGSADWPLGDELGTAVQLVSDTSVCESDKSVSGLQKQDLASAGVATTFPVLTKNSSDFALQSALNSRKITMRKPQNTGATTNSGFSLPTVPPSLAEAGRTVAPNVDRAGRSISPAAAAQGATNGTTFPSTAESSAFETPPFTGTANAVVASGAAGSWSLSNLGPRIIDKNFDPGFFVEHFIKDMGIAIDEANKMGLCLPGLALSKQLYEGLKSQGHGRDGTHALQLALNRLSGVDWN